MLPSQDVSRRPPGPTVRVVRFRHQDRAEPIGSVVADKQLQLVQPLQVEHQRAAGAVHFEAEEVLAPRTEAAGLQRADRAGGELQDGLDGVLDLDRTLTAVTARTP